MSAGTLETAFENAAQMMRDSGFGIQKQVQVAIDKKLPFMGYSTTSQDWRKHLIVVSGFAVESGLVEGLLIHEMSHIYRTETNHPSHNQKIVNSVISPILEKELSKDYERQVLHAAVNHIMDLYADDISFQVLRENESKLFSLDQMSRFFQDWVKGAPVTSGNRQRDKWVNAGIMLNNAFALSNMRRHAVTDLDRRGEALNEKFLSSINPEAAEKFDYFLETMVNLREDINDADFASLLKSYSTAFLQVVHTI